MKYRYYVGDPIIPWWVKKLVDCGLITSVRESAAITFILTYKTTYNDANKHYLYDGDFLELNEETGAVTIGYEDWNRALAEDFEKINWDKFVENLKKNFNEEYKKKAAQESLDKAYWGNKIE